MREGTRGDNSSGEVRPMVEPEFLAKETLSKVERIGLDYELSSARRMVQINEERLAEAKAYLAKVEARRRDVYGK